MKGKKRKEVSLTYPKDILKVASILIKGPVKTLNSFYDEMADVLYVNFDKSNFAEDSELTEDDTIIRYGSQGAVIGVTFLNASKRKNWGNNGK